MPYDEADAIVRLMSSSVDGATPAGLSRKWVRNALQGRTAGATFEALQHFKSACAEVGLKVTVNNLERAVRTIQVRGGVATFPPLYKGVSFNPSSWTGKRREWLLLLDFFALLRNAFKDGLACRSAVFDASLYWVVNLLGEEGLSCEKQEPEQAADEIISFLLESTNEDRFFETMETAKTRNAYLWAIASEFPASNSPQVFTLLDVWKNTGFKRLFAKALKTFCVFDGKWRVKDPVSYERYMPYSPWVTPLVAAEQALLAGYGFQANLAPTSEAVWNRVIDRMAKETRTSPYVIWMYSRDVASSLPYDCIPFFSDSREVIEEKLNTPQAAEVGLAELCAKLVSPFLASQEKLPYCDARKTAKLVYDFASKIDEKAAAFSGEKTPARSLEAMGWLSVFPAGTC